MSSRATNSEFETLHFLLRNLNLKYRNQVENLEIIQVAVDSGRSTVDDYPQALT